MLRGKATQWFLKPDQTSVEARIGEPVVIPPPATPVPPPAQPDRSPLERAAAATHVVFSGGGAKGVALWRAFCGVCDVAQHVYRRDPFDAMRGAAGTSFGALLALLVCGSPSRSQVDDLITAPAFWTRERWQRHVDLTLLGRASLMPNSVLLALVDEVLEHLGLPRNLTFADLHRLTGRDLVCNASNFTTYRNDVFSRATHPTMPVREAVATSMCYPLCFEPFLRYGETLRDGGLFCNLLLDPFPESRTTTLGFFVEADPPAARIGKTSPRRGSHLTMLYDLVTGVCGFHDAQALEHLSTDARAQFVPVYIAPVEPANETSPFARLLEADASDLEALCDAGTLAALQFLLPHGLPVLPHALGTRASELLHALEVKHDPAKEKKTKRTDEGDAAPALAIPLLKRLVQRAGGTSTSPRNEPPSDGKAVLDAASDQSNGDSEPETLITNRGAAQETLITTRGAAQAQVISVESTSDVAPLFVVHLARPEDVTPADFEMQATGGTAPQHIPFLRETDALHFLFPPGMSPFLSLDSLPPGAYWDTPPTASPPAYQASSSTFPIAVRTHGVPPVRVSLPPRRRQFRG